MNKEEQAAKELYPTTYETNGVRYDDAYYLVKQKAFIAGSQWQAKQVEQPAKNEPTPDELDAIVKRGVALFNNLKEKELLRQKFIKWFYSHELYWPTPDKCFDWITENFQPKAAPKGDDVIRREDANKYWEDNCIYVDGENAGHFITKDDFLAYDSQFKSAPQAVKWVQASEKLPDKAGQENKVIVVGDHKSLPFIAWGYKNFADEPTIYVDIGAKSFLAVSSNANFHSTYPIENIKWLEDKNQTK